MSNAATERMMLDQLYKRYSRLHGNGPRYVCAEHVKSHAGHDARRCADFIAQDLWAMKGLALIGHEVKVTRADWLTELKSPEKAEEFRRYMDYWYLVVPHAGIVRGDLPRGWGLMAMEGSRLRVVRRAPRLAAEPMPRTMMAPLMRAVAKTAVHHAAQDTQALVSGDEHEEQLPLTWPSDIVRADS